jgi:hypothetical protein
LRRSRETAAAVSLSGAHFQSVLDGVDGRVSAGDGSGDGSPQRVVAVLLEQCV